MVGRSSHGQSGVGEDGRSVPKADDEPISDVDSWLDEWTDLFSEDESTAPEPTKAAQPTSDDSRSDDSRSSDSESNEPRSNDFRPIDPAPTSEVPLGLPSAEANDDDETDEHLDKIGSAPPSQAKTLPRNDVSARRVSKSGGVVAEPPTTPGFDAATLARPETPKRIQPGTVGGNRKARFMPKPEADSARVTGEITSQDTGADRKLIVAMSIVAVVAAAGLIGYLLTGLGGNRIAASEARTSESTAPAGPTGDSDTAGASVVSVEILARSTVQLIGLDQDGQPSCAGSGVIVGTDGTILTNAHVVTTSPSCDFSAIGVGVIEDTSSPAQLLYRAEIVAVDRTLDLAVLRIASYLDASRGGLPTSFPAVPLGDSETVGLGDSIRILGFPVMGGETITFTTGSVAGFTPQAGVGSRALIKTDATISAGNSGGMAVNTRGQVIGVPTKAMASEGGPAVDCRPLEDTNDDGAIDAADVCVPVGGFLNGVRPINLALPILADAVAADPIGSVLEPEEVGPPLDLSEVVFHNPQFSLGRVDDEPAEVVPTIAAGAEELCFFVDWANMPAGATWDGVWFVDGEMDDALGFTGEVWTLAETDKNFWLCFPGRDDEGLAAGTYEIGIFVEGTLMFAEGIRITEDEVPVHPIRWFNKTGEEICELRVNPLADSGQVGLNELDIGESIPPDEYRSLELPEGQVIVEARNCEGNVVADAYQGILIEEPATIHIGIPAE